MGSHQYSPPTPTPPEVAPASPNPIWAPSPVNPYAEPDPTLSLAWGGSEERGFGEDLETRTDEELLSFDPAEGTATRTRTVGATRGSEDPVGASVAYATSVDADPNGASWGTSTRVDTGDVTRERAHTTSLAFEDGPAWSVEDKSTRTAANGDETGGSRRETRGLVWGDDVGARWGSETSEDDGHRKITGKDAARVTTSGAELSSERGIATHGDLSTGAKVSGSAGFTLITEPVPGTNLVDVVLTLKVGGGLGRTEGTKDVNLGVSARASGAVEFRHTLQADELPAYVARLEAVDAGAPATGGPPELGLLAKIRAASTLPATGFDAQGARDLGDGDAVSVTLAAGATGEASVHGVSAKASNDWTRTVAVKAGRTPDGRRCVDLTISFGEATERAGGAEVSEGAVSVGAEASRKTSDTDSATFRLDPEADDYEAVYDLLVAASTWGELQAIARDPDVERHRASGSRVATDTGRVAETVGVGGITASYGQTSSRSTSVTGGPDGAAAMVTGSKGAEASVLGMEERRTATASATVGASGVSLRTEESHARTALGVGEGGVDAAMAGGPLAVLRAEFTTQVVTIRKGTDLNEAEVRRLFERPADHVKWSACAAYRPPRVYLAWVALGETLLHPTPDPVDAQIAPDLAHDVARAAAIADFVAAEGSAGIELLRSAAQQWEGERDLGTTYEWPKSIADQREVFEGLEREVAATPAQMPEMPGYQRLAGLLLRWRRLYDVVDRCPDFAEPRAKLDLLDLIGQYQLTTEGMFGQHSRGEPVDARVCTDDERSADGEVLRLEALMESYKRAELTQFARIRAYLRDPEASYLSQLATAASRSFDPTAPLRELTATRDLYEAWVDDILALRAAYEQASTNDVEEFLPVVSLRPNDPRHLDTEPDTATYMALSAALSENETSGIGAEAADVQRRFARY